MPEWFFLFLDIFLLSLVWGIFAGGDWLFQKWVMQCVDALSSQTKVRLPPMDQWPIYLCSFMLTGVTLMVALPKNQAGDLSRYWPVYWYLIYLVGTSYCRAFEVGRISPYNLSTKQEYFEKYKLTRLFVSCVGILSLSFPFREGYNVDLWYRASLPMIFASFCCVLVHYLSAALQTEPFE